MKSICCVYYLHGCCHLKHKNMQFFLLVPSLYVYIDLLDYFQTYKQRVYRMGN